MVSSGEGASTAVGEATKGALDALEAPNEVVDNLNIKATPSLDLIRGATAAEVSRGAALNTNLHHIESQVFCMVDSS